MSRIVKTNYWLNRILGILGLMTKKRAYNIYKTSFEYYMSRVSVLAKEEFGTGIVEPDYKWIKETFDKCHGN